MPDAPESIAAETPQESIAAEEQPESIASETEADGAKDGGGKGDGKNEEAAGEKKDAPEDWDLAAPEDFPLPEENLKSFVEAAKKLGLSREQAEGMLAWHRDFDSRAQDFARQEQARIAGEWDREIMADKDFGGANFKATVADARKALGQFDEDGSLRKMLRDTGYDRNPAIIRVAARVGRAMGEHQFVGQNGGGKTKAPLEERMYADMKI